jgi:hypothetical protein
MYSSDGINWTEGGTLSQTYGWRCGAYGNGVYVICSNNGKDINYSYDGISWANAGNIGAINDVAFGNGVFVATAFNPNKTAYVSSNGINWTTVSLPNNASYFGIAFGDGKFVAVSYNQPPAYSYNGYDWANGDISVNAAWTAVDYGNGVFETCAITSSNTGISSNGISFGTTNLPWVANWSCIKRSSSVWVVAGSYQGTTYGAYSYDNYNWGQSYIPQGVTCGVEDLAVSGNLFVLVDGNPDGEIYHSTDGINWGGSAGLPWNAPQKAIMVGG